jgi:hypothetical protein
MFAGLSVEDMIELRLDLIYLAQKIERGFVAILSQRSRERNSQIYTADQLKEGKEAVEYAQTMIRGSAQKLLPELSFLAEENVPR